MQATGLETRGQVGSVPSRGGAPAAESDPEAWGPRCVSRHTTNALLPELREATTHTRDVESDAIQLIYLLWSDSYAVDVPSARACGALWPFRSTRVVFPFALSLSLGVCL